ncbi:outer membrane protein OmpA-like peptidoglycan-associated protein [Runella defluvii]|uniref:Outer membrane protein OmpA-like peptidoglycan-associated protein n=1 Tax=Runella defluvii TaxID=370973 RepID=A0A7W6ENI8_9BACT|nr:OmpA family protein [Runella defluvii]MBB3836655.1 outer membrane protein OmpA-like peptidoglycan-associated protein [Runella defluvii]
MKTMLLLVGVCVGEAWGSFALPARYFTKKEETLMAVSIADTVKPKKTKETVVKSTLDNSKGELKVKDAQIVDSEKQSGLIKVTFAIRDVETNALLTRVKLRTKDSKTGQEFEPKFNSADKNFSINVLPNTVVSIYVTAKGYTEASANINDIKHDRVLGFELQKIKPSVLKIRVLDKATDRPIIGSILNVRTKSNNDVEFMALKDGFTELTYDAEEQLEVEASAKGFTPDTKQITIETALTGKSYELTYRLDKTAAPAAPAPPAPTPTPPPVVATTPPPAAPKATAATNEPPRTSVFSKEPPKAPAPSPFSELVKGKVITLNNIYFDQSSPVLRPESAPQLDELVAILQKNPTARIEIRGHTDNAGDFDLNVKLSRERCQAVVEYLKTKGISADRLESRGRGPLDPLAPNTSEENRKRNRRVEFVAL